MTLDECIDAISKVIDAEFTYENGAVTAVFPSHGEAFRTILAARQALCVMRSVASR